MSFSSTGCHPNLTHWCPGGNHPVNNPEKSLQNRCRAWEGKELITWRLLYSLPKAHAAHIWPKSTALQGGPLSPACNQAIQTGWKSHLRRWFNTTSPRWACTPPGYVFLCGLKQNKLPFEGSAERTYSKPPSANLFTCIDNIQHVGECAVGLLGPRGIGVTIYNTTQPRQKRALGLILAGIGATVGMIAPWGGFAYHEITLRNLSTQIGNLAKSTGDAISKLKASLDSLANVVMDNRLALHYLLAEQGGVCAVEDIKRIYDHATWLHEFGKGGASARAVWKAVKSALPSLKWLVPLLGPFVSSRIKQFYVKSPKKERHQLIVLGSPRTYISPLDASGQRFRETTGSF
uniref:Envelope glycoprotein n=1 Tax=Aotus nancymaae TaxID=37293 RepID=A0A2K5CXL8_AOTNA